MSIENWAGQDQSPVYVDVLDRQIVARHGSLERQLLYIRGHHNVLGRLHWGWQGAETIVEKDVIKPIRVFMVQGGTE